MEKPNIVIVLSANEIKIISQTELLEMQKSAIEFDGFEDWRVLGEIVKDIELSNLLAIQHYLLEHGTNDEKINDKIRSKQ